MGVRGLWEVAKPIARPVTLESLARKKLAVDASIWIYQFLKAVRDSEGNAMRNGHIIGFFRRICKLLYFDIKPVFVFDGDAPTLKKTTINRRRERRQGRRQAASQTASRLLTVQLQRLAAQAEAEGKVKRKWKGKERADESERGTGDDIPDNVVYFDERNVEVKQKPFRAQDQYHLPDVGAELPVDVMDPRLMTEEELAEYADEFGSQINHGLYDTSFIDFESPEFYSLPKTTQYQLLNTARLRSRLRMGYSSDQLDELFPDRMQFSKFQIQRVTQRNFLTQKVMGLVGMEEDLSRRLAGDKNREYILKKNENGWSLDLGGKDGVIELDQDGKEVKVEVKEEEEEDVEFEDVPLEGSEGIEEIPEEISFLPETLNNFEALVERQNFYDQRKEKVKEAEDSDLKAIRKNSLLFAGDQVKQSEDKSSEDFDFMNAIKENSLLFASSDKQSEDKSSEDSDLMKAIKQNSLLFASSDQVKQSEDKSSEKNPVILPPWFIDSDEEGDHIETIAGIKPIEKVDELDSSGLTSYEYGKMILDQRQDEMDKEEKETIEISDDESKLVDSDDDIVEVVNPFSDDSVRTVAREVSEPSVPAPSVPVPSVPVTLPVSSVPVPSVSVSSVSVEPASSEISDEISKPSSSPSPITLNSEQLELAEEDAKYDEEEDEELTENLLQELQESERFTKSLNNGLINNRSKQDYEKEIDELRQQHKKEVRDSDEVTQTMISECQELLKRFGIPYITAPMEAEAQCATLMQLELVDGIVTDDSDCFLFGGGRVYKNMFNQSKYVESYEARDLEREFDLDRIKLIKLAQLLGSDYTDGLAGVGPVTALELLAEFNSDDGLERFRNWWKKVQSLDPSADFSTDFRRKFKKNASKLFLSDNFPDENVTKAYLEPIVDEDETPFEWGIPDLDGLRTYLIGMTGWNKEKIDEMLIPVIQDINKRRARLEKTSRVMIQSSLSDFANISARKKVEIGGSKRVRNAMESLIEQAEKRKRK